MQVIFENEDKKSNSGEENSVSIVVYAGRVSICMEKMY